MNRVFGTHRLWIYLAVGAVIYLVIYLILQGSGGSSGGGLY